MKSFKLSPSQIPEWYAYQYDPTSPVYNVSFNHFFFKNINLNYFVATWENIFKRHDIFRIYFGYENSEPRQYLISNLKLILSEILIDHSDLEKDAVIKHQEKYAKEYSNKAFNLEKGPLFRLKIIAYPNQEYQLIFTIHHVIWDETSTINLMNEFHIIYNALVEKQSPKLPKIKSTFFDYVQQYHKDLENGFLDQELKYWLAKLSGQREFLTLPTDRPRPAFNTYHGNTKKHWLNKSLIRDANTFIRHHNVSLFMLMISILNIYFYKVTGQTQIITGFPMAGRDRPEYKNLLGCFALPIPFVCNINPKETFLDFLKKIKQSALECFENRKYPCVKLIEKLDHNKDHTSPKLFSVMVGVQNNKDHLMDISFSDGSYMYSKEIFTSEDHGARFEIAIGLDPIGSDIKLFCTYNTDLFESETIERMLTNVCDLLQKCVRNPKELIARFSLAPKPELLNFNINSNLVPDLIKSAFYNFSKNPAILFGEQTITYSELDKMVTRFSIYLLQRGVEKNDVIGIKLSRTPELIVVVLAAMSIGVCYVPIHINLPDKKIQQIVQDSNLKLIIEEYPYLEEINSQSLYYTIDKQQLMYTIYTSGTTGQPKAIPITHQGVAHLLEITQDKYQIKPLEKILFNTSISFDASILEVFWPLCYGACIVIPTEEQLDGSSLIQLIQDKRINIFQTTPVLLGSICQTLKLKQSNKIDLNSIRQIICGSSSLSRELLENTQYYFKCNIANHYGPTECTVDASVFDCSQSFVGNTVPIGKPLRNVQIYILDANGNQVPVGASGEICISSPGNTPQYQGKLYYTGDIGKIANDGNIYFLGRKDNQVKINSNRVELEEIEVALSSHPAITAAAVIKKRERLMGYLEIGEHVNSFSARGIRYYQLTTLTNPELKNKMVSIHLETWPKYFNGSPVIKKYWKKILSLYPQYQFCLVTENGEVATVSNGIPLYWDGTDSNLPQGWDDGIRLSFIQLEKNIKPNTLLGLTGIVAQSFQGRGLSEKIVRGFRNLAAMYGLNNFLGPVRPVGFLNSECESISEWINQVDSNGEPKDFWLKQHKRIGADILSEKLQSQYVEGTLDEWENWTSRRFIDSGKHSIPETLAPVVVDVENNRVTYFDPIIWVAHRNLTQQCQIKPLINKEIIKKHLLEYIPSYMIPEIFYFLIKMPTTTSEKIDYQSLSRLEVGLSEEEYIVKPNNFRHRVLCQWWKEILKINGEVGITQDFFNLGGQSLHVIELLNKIEKEYKIKLNIKDFYLHSTIQQLEKIICSKVSKTPEFASC